ncbi:MAG: ATP-binding cassette domain-containing protein [Terrimicrobiaceae bacterium]|nr:ATP-binding cassette domain-containing protein [Terrimicrobiaceae bacterium]
MLSSLGGDIFLFVGGVLAIQGQISFGSFFAFYAYQAMLWGPIGILLNAGQTLQMGTASAEKVEELGEMPQEAYIGRTSISPDSFGGRIIAENLSFSYGGSEPILRDLTFSIEPGQMTALVGQSGSGKTTLASILMGMYLESDLRQARGDLERLDIVAPGSGVILSTARRFPGEKVLAGTPLFKLTSNAGTELGLYATEDRVNRIRPGQLVRFRASNTPDRLAPLATGRVSEVALDRDLDSGQEEKAANSSYRIKVAVEKTPYPIAVGATVLAETVIDRRPFWRLLFSRRAQEIDRRNFFEKSASRTVFVLHLPAGCSAL